MTPEEAKTLIVAKLTPKIRRELGRSDFVQAWNALTAARQNQIIAAAIANKPNDAGKGLVAMLQAFSKTQAELRADDIVSDSSINLEEFGEIFK